MGPPHGGSLSDFNEVWEVRALKGRPKAEEAQAMLERVAHQVRPIMRKRGWRVVKLSEFCPSNKALLGVNVNRGREVRIRLRHPGDDMRFFPYEALLGTMLHELAHMARGPHDAQFYKVLDELTKECEELMALGIIGDASRQEGFSGSSLRAGGYNTAKKTGKSAAAAAAAAAVKRQHSAVLPSGPQRLGGDRELMRALSPMQAAAMAAERRMRDNAWCGEEWEGDETDAGGEPGDKAADGISHSSYGSGAGLEEKGAPAIPGKQNPSTLKGGSGGRRGGEGPGMDGLPLALSRACRPGGMQRGAEEEAMGRKRKKSVQGGVKEEGHRGSEEGGRGVPLGRRWLQRSSKPAEEKLDTVPEHPSVGLRPAGAGGNEEVVSEGDNDVVVLFSKSKTARTGSGNTHEVDRWRCSRCTFDNLALLCCEMCGIPRPLGKGDTPSLVNVPGGAGGQKERVQAHGGSGQSCSPRKEVTSLAQAEARQEPSSCQWSCAMCTLENSSYTFVCDACGCTRPQLVG